MAGVGEAMSPDTAYIVGFMMLTVPLVLVFVFIVPFLIKEMWRYDRKVLLTTLAFIVWGIIAAVLMGYGKGEI